MFEGQPATHPCPTGQPARLESAAGSTSAPAGQGNAAAAGGCPYIGLSRRDALLLPMLVWDASMAASIGRQLDASPALAVSMGVNPVYIHVCVCVCVYSHTHTHIYIYIYIIYIYIYLFIYIHIHIYIYIGLTRVWDGD